MFVGVLPFSAISIFYRVSYVRAKYLRLRSQNQANQKDELKGVRQNSKSKENWIWRAPVPAMGCLNPVIGIGPEPNTELIWDTFVRLNRLKNSATRSRRFAPPNGKYLSTRKSAVNSVGVSREFLPRVSGLAESGKAWLRFVSRPVSGFSGRPLSTLRIGATSI